MNAAGLEVPDRLQKFFQREPQPAETRGAAEDIARPFNGRFPNNIPAA